QQYFSLQPVLIEHVTERLVSSVVAAFGAAELEVRARAAGGAAGALRHALNALQLLNTHSLVKATAKENVRDSQQRLILRPIAERLVAHYGHELGAFCTTLLNAWRE